MTIRERFGAVCPQPAQQGVRTIRRGVELPLFARGASRMALSHDVALQFRVPEQLIPAFRTLAIVNPTINGQTFRQLCAENIFRIVGSIPDIGPLIDSPELREQILELLNRSTGMPDSISRILPRDVEAIRAWMGINGDTNVDLSVNASAGAIGHLPEPLVPMDKYGRDIPSCADAVEALRILSEMGILPSLAGAADLLEGPDFNPQDLNSVDGQ